MPPPAERTRPPGVGITALPPKRTVAPQPAPAAEPIQEATELSTSAPGDLSGSHLGGYELKTMLGQGAMGSVYLARQLSLDRDVALKVMSPTLSADPQFVARFTREAFAAAQMSHHNVVQIHDIGVQSDVVDGEINFFSMEFVPGQTLGRLIRDHGKLDPEAAVSYVLQAARGLVSAHAHGLIHRDIKPDNLLLNGQGLVKVADLGLVKRAGASDTIAPAGRSPVPAPGATQFGMAMGTPAYMPPEQAQNAGTVDVRADIYALGCTLYDLLTGRPPFIGRTAAEVMTQHANAPVVPPDRLANHVPANLSAIVMRMIAKQPVRRYQSMAEVVKALEEYLGIEAGKPFSPREEHVDRLEQAAAAFDSSRWLRYRQWIIRGFAMVSVVAVLIAALLRPWWAVGIGTFAMLAAVFYALIVGVAQRTMLARKLRQLAVEGGPMVWLRLVIVIAVLGLLLVILGAQYSFVGIALLAAVAAGGFYAAIDRKLAADRRAPLAEAENLLRDLRLGGLEESAVRQFVWKYAGRWWEALFEQLFGYPALLEGRRWEARRAAGRVGEQAKRRPRFAPWRDPLLVGIDRVLARRQRIRQAKLLAKLECRALEAKGFESEVAEKQGEENARRLIKRAKQIRESAAELQLVATAPPAPAPLTKRALPHLGRTIAPPPAATGMPAAVSSNWMHQSDVDDDSEESWEPRSRQTYLRRRFGAPIDVVFGSGVRLVVSLLILAAFAVWFDRNGGEVAREQAAQLMGSREEAVAYVQRVKKTGAMSAVQTVKTFAVNDDAGRPLQLAHVPDWACTAVGRWNGGLAGVLLLLSTFFSGPLLALSMFAAAGACLFGDRLPWPATVPLNPVAAADALGLIIWILGVFFLRRTIAEY